MRRTWSWGLSGGVALALLAPSSAVNAQAAAIEGSYVLVPEESADVRAAVREGTQKANFFVRNFGRGVLERTLEPADTLRIVFDTSGVTITTTGADLLHTPLDGDAIEVQNPAGETERVATYQEDGALRRVFDAGRGTREFLYTLDQDGAGLDVMVEVRSTMFPDPIHYRLRYRRVAGSAVSR